MANLEGQFPQGQLDLSKGISRGVAYDMQSEAEAQLRHQIRDAISILKTDQRSVNTVRQNMVTLK